MASKWLNYTIRDGMGELSLKKCYGPVWIRWAGHLSTRALHVGDTSAGMLLRNGKHERNRGRSQVPAFHHNPLSDRFVEKILRRFKKRLRREQMPHDKRMKHTHTHTYIYIYSHIHTDKYTNTSHIVLTWNSCTWRRSSASSRFRCSQRRSFHSGGIGGGAGCLTKRVII